MLYRYGVIRSFLLFLLSMSDVLYYYPHFIEREMRSREVWNMGKKEVGSLDLWLYSGCSLPWQCHPTCPFHPFFKGHLL